MNTFSKICVTLMFVFMLCDTYVSFAQNTVTKPTTPSSSVKTINKGKASGKKGNSGKTGGKGKGHNKYPSRKNSSSSSASAQEDEYIPANSINKHEWVDLGLSVVWATCNVGASQSNVYGDYFAWGEIEPKSSYTQDNSDTYNMRVGDIIGNAQYDAATANWGAPWRMPSAAEIYELLHLCKWERVDNNDYNGFNVTGPNGNSIFIPATSFQNGTFHTREKNDNGRYWSGMAAGDDDKLAFGISIGSSKYTMGFEREMGLSVRPVAESSNATGLALDTYISSPTGNIGGYGYVDLGLSVKWATCNVGASKPSVSGNHYGWGEVRPKSSYTKKSYKTKVKKKDISGNDSYDAARVAWGSSWRMPTKDEIDELVSSCNWVWTSYEGHLGMKVTGPNGNSIFLPAAGYYHDSIGISAIEDTGRYWGSTMMNKKESIQLFFDHNNKFSVKDERYPGYSIRPVTR